MSFEPSSVLITYTPMLLAEESLAPALAPLDFSAMAFGAGLVADDCVAFADVQQTDESAINASVLRRWGSRRASMLFMPGVSAEGESGCLVLLLMITGWWAVCPSRRYSECASKKAWNGATSATFRVPVPGPSIRMD